MKIRSLPLAMLCLLGVPLVFGSSAHAAPAKTLDLVFIGDSITAGVGTDNRATQAAPTMATQALQKRLGTTTVFMTNQGHSGYTTVNFLPNGKTLASVETAAKALAVAHPGSSSSRSCLAPMIAPTSDRWAPQSRPPITQRIWSKSSINS
ncbi:MAG: SGNH/GDSL hydrolase family protein [Chthoniobacteraceae bacterium]